MTYLKPTTCELLHKLGVKCETGMWWRNYFLTDSRYAPQEWSVSDSTYNQDDEMSSQYTRNRHPDQKEYPAYSLPLLITDSEAIKLVYPVKECDEKWCCQRKPHGHSYSIKNAHYLLDLCLYGDYEAAEQLLVEALTERK